jgi:hypothetical protein
MISRQFTITVTNKRMSWSNDSGQDVAVGSFLAHYQQAGKDVEEQLGQAMGTVYSVWCDFDTDVEVGDTLTVASGNYSGEYSVKAKKENLYGRNKHINLVCVKDVS